MLNNKFILFANARSGSTSLAKLLSESSDVNLCMEPFHPNYSKWNKGERNYSKFIKDDNTMNQALEEIFSKYNAMKVLVYQFSDEIYTAMLARKDFKILFLRRGNLARAALSSLIGQQTDIWHSSEVDESAYDKLKPIEISEIENIVNYVGKMNGIYENYLKENRKDDYINLSYEELYSDDMNKNVETITRICEFLQIKLPPSEVIKKYMLPTNAKQNKDDLYKKVPNWKRIEEKFPGIFS